MRYHKLFLARKFAVGEWFKFSRLNVLCNSSIGAFFIKKKNYNNNDFCLDFNNPGRPK
jgi:hypothetical protein